MDWRSPPLRRGSSGPNYASVRRTPARVRIPFAPPIYCFSAFAEAHLGRNRTAKLGNREQRDQLPAIGPELAVSGSDSAVPLSQDPAKAREFLGGSRSAGAESLQPQTRWRREWDSNPRYPSGYTRSPGACLKPLGHLSARSPTPHRVAPPRSGSAPRRAGGEGGIRTLDEFHPILP